MPGQGPEPCPLLLSHGWPGSVFEFLELIPRLTDPARFGGDPADAFTVVAPSLPGYGLSFAPGQPRFGSREIADCFAELMTDVLGYARFAAQGGDWGAFITSRLGAVACRPAARHPPEPAGRAARPEAGRRPDARGDSASSRELEHWLKEETGYQWIQGTRPQTLAFGLTDSPAGLAAWIVEKFRAWSDCGGDVESVFEQDELLANISLYWFTGAIGSSFWPYYARMHGPWPIPDGGIRRAHRLRRSSRARSCSPPRSVAERTTGHPALERRCHAAATSRRWSSPKRWPHEIAEFFRPLRG